MISATLGTDLFVVWSLPYEQALALAPAPARPTRCEERGWLMFAAVEVGGARVIGCPVPGSRAVGAWMVLVDLPGARRGNCFIRLLTPSRLVAFAAARRMDATLVRHGPLVLTRDPSTITACMPGEIDLVLDRATQLTAADQRRMESLFANDHSGVIRRGRRLFEIPLDKRHWRMSGHQARVEEAALLAPLDARLEFAFDASDDRGRWGWPIAVETGP